MSQILNCENEDDYFSATIHTDTGSIKWKFDKHGSGTQNVGVDIYVPVNRDPLSYLVDKVITGVEFRIDKDHNGCCANLILTLEDKVCKVMFFRYFDYDENYTHKLNICIVGQIKIKWNADI
jgi:hypothetical protein